MTRRHKGKPEPEEHVAGKPLPADPAAAGGVLGFQQHAGNRAATAAMHSAAPEHVRRLISGRNFRTQTQLSAKQRLFRGGKSNATMNAIADMLDDLHIRPEAPAQRLARLEKLHSIVDQWMRSRGATGKSTRTGHMNKLQTELEDEIAQLKMKAAGPTPARRPEPGSTPARRPEPGSGGPPGGSRDGSVPRGPDYGSMPEVGSGGPPGGSRDASVPRGPDYGSMPVRVVGPEPARPTPPLRPSSHSIGPDSRRAAAPIAPPTPIAAPGGPSGAPQQSVGGPRTGRTGPPSLIPPDLGASTPEERRARQSPGDEIRTWESWHRPWDESEEIQDIELDDDSHKRPRGDEERRRQRHERKKQQFGGAIRKYAFVSNRKKDYRSEFTAGSDKISRDYQSIKARYEQQGEVWTPELQVEWLTGLGWSDDEARAYQPYLENAGKQQRERPVVKEVSKDERVHYRLNLKGGVLYRGAEPEPFDTVKNPKEFWSLRAGAGFAIFVMSKGGKLFAGTHKVGLFHHSSFLRGKDTAGSGEAKFEGGKITALTNKSGHYVPGKRENVQVLNELRELGMSLNFPFKELTERGQEIQHPSAAKYLQDNLDVLRTRPPTKEPTAGWAD
ncbi:MAG TPA: hypothetical protein VEG38_19805 [Acidimicrobiia bacterium]|nr:hypothetical protein [Acidimicrobiia bacterium]